MSMKAAEVGRLDKLAERCLRAAVKFRELLAHEEGTFLTMQIEKEVYKLFGWDQGGSVDYLRRIPGSM